MSTLSCTGDEDKRLQIGVDDGELQPLEVVHLEPVDGVGARAAHADQLDGDGTVGEDLVRERQLVVVGVELHGSGGDQDALEALEKAAGAARGGGPLRLRIESVIQQAERPC